jgi:hypothetical protein
MRMAITTLLVLLTRTIFSETIPLLADEIEEGVSYAYPLFFDNAESSSTSDHVKPLPQKDPFKKEVSSTVWEGKLGNGKITVEAENTEELSQFKAQREKAREKNMPKKYRTPRSKKDEEDDKDHSPRVSIKWATGD